MIHGQNTPKMTKHVGKYNDKRCVIVIQLPESTNLVDIIDTDSLPSVYHQNLMDIVNSPEGQAARWLGEVLSRKMLFDGTNAMRTFYEKKIVQSVPSELVSLTPTPSQQIAFTDVYPVTVDPLEEQYAKLAAEAQEKLSTQQADDDGFNQHAVNLASDAVIENQQIANNLIAEAVMLENEAANKRAKAVQLTGAISGGTGPFVDMVTGKSYKSAGALKGAITRRENAAVK